MPLAAVVSQTQALEGREAAVQATQQALELLGKNPVLGFVIASHYYPIQQVVSGIATLLGDAPLIGFSTSAELTTGGQNQRSVAVALISGADIQTQADWWPGYSEDSRLATQKINQAFELSHAIGSLLVVADGLNGDAKLLCAALAPGDYTLAGCLAGGDLRRARTYQVGGRKSGYNGLAAALLSGNIVIGVGLSHGWQPVGAYYKVTRARGPWVRTLDDHTVADVYGKLFSYQAREWAFPPLNELARLYPLGIEQEGKEAYLIRAPIRMEADGSLRMNTAVPEGSIVHLMTGSVDSCLEASRKAAQQALDNLGTARPVFALVLVDIAWQILLEANPGSEVSAIRSVLGESIPILGGYTFGQLAYSVPSRTPELYNQHIEVVLFGEPEE
jgi:hypothetical protein